MTEQKVADMLLIEELNAAGRSLNLLMLRSLRMLITLKSGREYMEVIDVREGIVEGMGSTRLLFLNDLKGSERTRRGCGRNSAQCHDRFEIADG